MGISGGFGGYVASALAGQGWQVSALMRAPKKLPDQFNYVNIIQGDASCVEDVRLAASEIDLIIYAINPANYDWEGKALSWLDIAATVAEENKLSLIFPGNAYVLNPKDGPDFDETVAIDPVSSKGKTRKAMEERLKRASENGAKVIILRCGDFIGKNAPSTWMRQLIKTTKCGYKLASPGPKNLTHTWAYLPDVAKAIAAISEKLNDLPGFTLFHFKGQRFSINELAEALTQLTGQQVTINNFPWFAIRLMSPFTTLMSGLYEMRYLWEVKINLDEKKLQHFLGKKLPSTSLNEILSESGLLRVENKCK